MPVLEVPLKTLKFSAKEEPWDVPWVKGDVISSPTEFAPLHQDIMGFEQKGVELGKYYAEYIQDFQEDVKDILSFVSCESSARNKKWILTFQPKSEEVIRDPENLKKIKAYFDTARSCFSYILGSFPSLSSGVVWTSSKAPTVGNRTYYTFQFPAVSAIEDLFGMSKATERQRMLSLDSELKRALMNAAGGFVNRGYVQGFQGTSTSVDEAAFIIRYVDVDFRRPIGEYVEREAQSVFHEEGKGFVSEPGGGSKRIPKKPLAESKAADSVQKALEYLQEACIDIGNRLGFSCETSFTAVRSSKSGEPTGDTRLILKVARYSHPTLARDQRDYLLFQSEYSSWLQTFLPTLPKQFGSAATVGADIFHQLEVRYPGESFKSLSEVLNKLFYSDFLKEFIGVGKLISSGRPAKSSKTRKSGVEFQVSKDVGANIIYTFDTTTPGASKFIDAIKDKMQVFKEFFGTQYQIGMLPRGEDILVRVLREFKGGELPFGVSFPELPSPEESVGEKMKIKSKPPSDTPLAKRTQPYERAFRIYSATFIPDWLKKLEENFFSFSSGYYRVLSSLMRIERSVTFDDVTFENKWQEVLTLREHVEKDVKKPAFDEQSQKYVDSKLENLRLQAGIAKSRADSARSESEKDIKEQDYLDALETAQKYEEDLQRDVQLREEAKQRDKENFRRILDNQSKRVASLTGELLDRYETILGLMSPIFGVEAFKKHAINLQDSFNRQGALDLSSVELSKAKKYARVSGEEVYLAAHTAHAVKDGMDKALSRWSKAALGVEYDYLENKEEDLKPYLINRAGKSFAEDLKVSPQVYSFLSEKSNMEDSIKAALQREGGLKSFVIELNNLLKQVREKTDIFDQSRSLYKLPKQTSEKHSSDVLEYCLACGESRLKTAVEQVLEYCLVCGESRLKMAARLEPSEALKGMVKERAAYRGSAETETGQMLGFSNWIRSFSDSMDGFLNAVKKLPKEMLEGEYDVSGYPKMGPTADKGRLYGDLIGKLFTRSNITPVENAELGSRGQLINQAIYTAKTLAYLGVALNFISSFSLRAAEEIRNVAAFIATIKMDEGVIEEASKGVLTVWTPLDVQAVRQAYSYYLPGSLIPVGVSNAITDLSDAQIFTQATVERDWKNVMDFREALQREDLANNDYWALLKQEPGFRGFLSQLMADQDPQMFYWALLSFVQSQNSQSNDTVCGRTLQTLREQAGEEDLDLLQWMIQNGAVANKGSEASVKDSKELKDEAELQAMLIELETEAPGSRQTFADAFCPWFVGSGDIAETVKDKFVKNSTGAREGYGLLNIPYIKGAPSLDFLETREQVYDFAAALGDVSKVRAFCSKMKSRYTQGVIPNVSPAGYSQESQEPESSSWFTDLVPNLPNFGDKYDAFREVVRTQGAEKGIEILRNNIDEVEKWAVTLSERRNRKEIRAIQSTLTESTFYRPPDMGFFSTGDFYSLVWALGDKEAVSKFLQEWRTKNNELLAGNEPLAVNFHDLEAWAGGLTEKQATRLRKKLVAVMSYDALKSSDATWDFEELVYKGMEAEGIKYNAETYNIGRDGKEKRSAKKRHGYKLFVKNSNNICNYLLRRYPDFIAEMEARIVSGGPRVLDVIFGAMDPSGNLTSESTTGILRVMQTIGQKPTAVNRDPSNVGVSQSLFGNFISSATATKQYEARKQELVSDYSGRAPTGRGLNYYTTKELPPKGVGTPKRKIVLGD